MTLEEMAQLPTKRAQAQPPPEEKQTLIALEEKFRPEKRYHANEVEPWLLEQLQLMSCPECAETMEVFHSVQNGVRYYMCTGSPALHRWAIVDHKEQK